MPILLVSFSLLNLAAKTDYVFRSNHMTLQLSIVVVHTQIWLPQVQLTETTTIWRWFYGTRQRQWKEASLQIPPQAALWKTETHYFIYVSMSAPRVCTVYTLHFLASDLSLQEAMNNDKLYVLPSSFCVSPPTIGFHSRNIMHFLCTCSANYKHSAAVNSVLASHFHSFFAVSSTEKLFIFHSGRMFFFNRSWSLQVIKFENNLRNDVPFFLRLFILFLATQVNATPGKTRFIQCKQLTRRLQRRKQANKRHEKCNFAK